MRAASAIGLAVLISATATARADSAKADEKFRLGKKLLAQKHYADACQAFEDSNKLDPGIGAELNIGHCYEEWGKLGTAYRAYEAAAAMAKSARDPRLAKIRERMDELDPQVPRLTIQVGHDTETSELVVTIDGEPLSAGDLGKEQRLDPGPHKIEYRIGDVKRSKLIPLERGGASDITLDLPAAAVAAEATKPASKHRDKAKDRDKDSDDSDKEPRVVAVLPGHTQRVEGAVAMAAGGVAMGVAGALTISAHGKYKDALAAHCNGDTTMCDMAGLTATHSARDEANIATVVFGVGAAMAITGIVLYATAPHGRARAEREEAMRVLPTVGPDGAGLVVLGRF